jgi:hypothetical protein
MTTGRINQVATIDAPPTPRHGTIAPTFAVQGVWSSSTTPTTRNARLWKAGVDTPPAVPHAAAR